MSDSMKEIQCEHCGLILGYVHEDAVPPNPDDWRHTRCMARVAKKWGADVAHVDSMRDVLARAIGACYPEVVDNGTGEVRLLRSRITAEVVLETLANCALKIVDDIPAKPGKEKEV